MGTMARRFYEIDWDKTTAYCPTPSGNGIYITPPSPDGRGVPAAHYDRFRRELVEKLSKFVDPATGEPVITQIWTREEAFAGARMAFRTGFDVVFERRRSRFDPAFGDPA